MSFRVKKMDIEHNYKLLKSKEELNVYEKKLCDFNNDYEIKIDSDGGEFGVCIKRIIYLVNFIYE